MVSSSDAGPGDMMRTLLWLGLLDRVVRVRVHALNRLGAGALSLSRPSHSTESSSPLPPFPSFPSTGRSHKMPGRRRPHHLMLPLLLILATTVRPCASSAFRAAVRMQ